MLQKVAIYSSENGAKTREVIQKLIEEFCRKGITIQLYEKSGDSSFCPEGRLIERFNDLNSLSGLPIEQKV